MEKLFIKTVKFEIYDYTGDLDTLCLNISSTYERYCKGKYIQIDRKVSSNKDIAKFTAHSSSDIDLEKLKDSVQFELLCSWPKPSFEFK